MSKPTKRPWRAEGRYLYGQGRNFRLAAFPSDGTRDSSVDRANLNLTVTAVNERDSLLAENAKLRQLLKQFPAYGSNEAICPHGEESWYCESCHYEWKQKLKDWHVKRIAALSSYRGD